MTFKDENKIILNLGNRNKWTCKFVDFATSADQGTGLKKSEEAEKYMDLTRKLNKIME